MNRNELYLKWRQYQNYAIIVIVSLMMLFLVPMLGSSVGMALILPNTTAGWIVYIATKITVILLNMTIFHCFILQAKVNVKDNPYFQEANEILRLYSAEDEPAPRSPRQYFASVYGKKGTTLAITTLLTTISLSQAILAFDGIAMLTYLFTIIAGVLFGIIQMNAAEVFWIEEYYKYAKKVEQDEKEKEMEMANQKMVEEKSLPLVAETPVDETDDTTGNTGGSDLLVPADGNSILSTCD